MESPLTSKQRTFPCHSEESGLPHGGEQGVLQAVAQWEERERRRIEFRSSLQEARSSLEESRARQDRERAQQHARQIPASRDRALGCLIPELSPA